MRPALQPAGACHPQAPGRNSQTGTPTHRLAPMTKHHRTTLAVATLLCCAAVAALAADPSPAAAAGGAATVDGARIAAADREPQNWLAHGRTYGEQRYSPLAQINDRNAGELGLAWSFPTATTRACRRARSWSTAPCTRPARGAWSGRSTRRPAASCGSTTLRSRVPGAATSAATPSTAGGGLEGRGVRRHDRRPPRFARREDRREALEVNTIDRSKPYSITGARAS